MNFARIHGHRRQIEILQRAIATGRVAHAYLFEGPEGVGKRLTALAMARALLCSNGDGCGECPACRKVDHGNHPDLHLIEPDGTSVKIEQIRHLQRELSFRPLEGSRRICILEGADRLNPAAGNALLKTLEEPAAGSLLILLTPRPEAVLATIRSRCQRLPFGRLPREIIRRALLEILDGDEVQAHVLSALAEGSFRKALGRDRDLYLDRRRDLLKAVTALSPGSVVPLFNLALQLAEEKERLPEILDILRAFYRDLFLWQHGWSEQELVNVDLMEKIRRCAAREDSPSLLRKLEAIQAAFGHLDRNVNRELALDVLLMRLAA